MSLIRVLQTGGCVSSVVWSPDSNTTFVSGGYDGSVKFWDTDGNNKIINSLKEHNTYIASVAYSPDGWRIASGSNDETIKIWNIMTTEVISNNLEKHGDTVKSVAWSPDSTKLVSGSYDNTVKIWNGRTGALIRTLEGHTCNVLSVAWKPDDTEIVASGSLDNTVRIWNAQTGENLKTLRNHHSSVRCVAWCPDGTKIASGSEDSNIQIWDPQTGKEILILHGHCSGVVSIAWSPDGTKIASGNNDNTIKIWDTYTGDVLATLKSHMQSVVSVAWSDDGTKIASGSMDGIIGIWDVSEFNEIQDQLEEFNKLQELFIRMVGQSCSHNRLNQIVNQLKNRGLRYLKQHELEKIKKIQYPFINLMEQLFPKDYVEVVSQQTLNDLDPEELVKIRWITVSNNTLRWVSAETFQWMFDNKKNVITNESYSYNIEELFYKLEEVKLMTIMELKNSVDQATLVKKIEKELDMLGVITELKTETTLGGSSYYKLYTDPDGEYFLINGKKKYLK